jgi:hypothetical protein
MSTRSDEVNEARTELVNPVAVSSSPNLHTLFLGKQFDVWTHACPAAVGNRVHGSRNVMQS